MLAVFLTACGTTNQEQASQTRAEILLNEQRDFYEKRIEALKQYPALDPRCGRRVSADRLPSDGALKTAVKLSKALTRSNDEKVACYEASERNRKAQAKR